MIRRDETKLAMFTSFVSFSLPTFLEVVSDISAGGGVRMDYRVRGLLETINQDRQYMIFILKEFHFPFNMRKMWRGK